MKLNKHVRTRLTFTIKYHWWVKICRKKTYRWEYQTQDGMVVFAINSISNAGWLILWWPAASDLISTKLRFAERSLPSTWPFPQVRKIRLDQDINLHKGRRESAPQRDTADMQVTSCLALSWSREKPQHLHVSQAIWAIVMVRWCIWNSSRRMYGKEGNSKIS